MAYDDDDALRRPKKSKADTEEFEEILEEAKDLYDLCIEHDNQNRLDFEDDVRFARLAEQWPDRIRKQRETEGRPCLTINRLPTFIRQVVNDARQNKPAITVHPADSVADPLTAEVISSLIRNIEYQSNADIAYDTALENAVTGGFGFFRINTRYTHDDTFEQEIVIETVPNPLSVYGDPYSTCADSADWNSAFVVDLMPKKRFEALYKDTEQIDWEATDGYGLLRTPWMEEDQIRTCEYWKRKEIKRTVLALSNGDIVEPEAYLANKAFFDQLMVSVIGQRDVRSYEVCQYLMTGAEVLTKTDWGGRYIPIVPVYGDEVNLAGERYFRSLVRDAKDPQQMFNYWRTMATELVALAPKAPFIGPKGAFETDLQKWETSNNEAHAFMEYDGQVPPQRQPFAGVPAGALQEALNAADDLKAITGIYDASLGARGNETSGRAISLRQREGDTATFHYIDNLSRAIRHAGRIIVDLIPKVYSTERIIRVMGPEREAMAIPINQPTEVQGPQGEKFQHVFDLTAGKYDVTVEAGPSFTTKREEASQQMLELIRAYPNAAMVLGDLLAKNLDWPGADEVAKRLHILLPPAIQEMEGGADKPQIPPEVQKQMGEAQQALQKQQGDLQKLQLQNQKLTETNMKLQQQLAAQQLDQANAQQKVELDAEKNDIAQQRADTERLKAVHEITTPPKAN